MAYLFTSESVSEGHPDKVADQISDALIDNFLAFDADSKVACETLVTTGQVILAGEVKSNTYLDVQQIAREVIRKIGYFFFFLFNFPVPNFCYFAIVAFTFSFVRFKFQLFNINLILLNRFDKLFFGFPFSFLLFFFFFQVRYFGG